MRDKLNNILIINPFGIGDVLFSTALVDVMAKQIEGCRIGFLCNRRAEPLLRHNPNLEWIFVYEKDEYRDLWRISKPECVKKFCLLLKDVKSKRFDAVIDLSLSRQFGFLTWLLGIPRRVGFNYRKRGWFLTRKIDIAGYNDKHMVEYYLSLLELLNLKPLSSCPKLYISDDDRRWGKLFLRESGVNDEDLIIGIVPGAGASWGKDAGIKHWNKERFSEISDELIEKLKAKIIIFGSESEAGICEAVAENMRNPSVNACGKTTLLQFAALASTCGLVIANDGGPLHMASAMGTATVGIFGPVSDRVYGQYPAGERHRVVKSGIECRPCYKNFKLRDCSARKCLDEISSREVFKAAEEVLRKQ